MITVVLITVGVLGSWNNSPLPMQKSLTKCLEKPGFRGRIETIHTTALFQLKKKKKKY